MNLSETIAGLESMLFDLHPDAKGIYSAISSLKEVNHSANPISLNQGVHTANGLYDPKSNTRVKILFAIKQLNRFARSREIAELLNQYEPQADLKALINSLSSPLYQLKTENKVFKLTVGTGNNNVYWGSAKWLDEQGNPLPEHMYKAEEKQMEIEI